MTFLEQLALNREVYAALIAAVSASDPGLPTPESPPRRPSNLFDGQEAASPPPMAAPQARPAAAGALARLASYSLSYPDSPPALAIEERSRGTEAAPASAIRIADTPSRFGEGVRDPAKQGPAGAAVEDVYDVFLRRHETEARRQSQLLTEEESI